MAVAARSADPLSQGDPDELAGADDSRRSQSTGSTHDRGSRLSDITPDPLVGRSVDAGGTRAG